MTRVPIKVLHRLAPKPGRGMGHRILPAVRSGILEQGHEGRFMQWFDLMGAATSRQGHLRAAHRATESQATYDIPRTPGLSWTLPAIRARWPSSFVRQRVMPAL
jgi:hypothetical protein